MHDFFIGAGTGHSLMILCFVIGIGLLVGHLKINGVRSGSIWVLFTGIVFAALGARTDQLFLHFLKEFGLVVYVFSVGLQVGDGLQLTGKGDRLKSIAVAAMQVILLFAGVFIIGLLTDEDTASLAGVATGSLNGITGVGAAQQTWYDAATGTFLSEVENPTASSRIGIAFALAYPAGILGICLAIWAVSVLSRVLVESDPEDAGTVRILFGTEVPIEGTDFNLVSSRNFKKELSVTRSSITGHSVKELDFLSNYGVTLSRVKRGSASLLPHDGMYLKVGDRITVSGAARNVKKVADLVGNSDKELDWPYLVPIFLGMAFGVVLGAIPFKFPGMEAPVRLGLSGGVFIIAVVLGKFGPSWKITTYTTPSAILMIRETGLALLLATIGLGCGSSLVPLFTSGGYMWILYGFLLSFIPALVVAFVACHLLGLSTSRVLGCLAASSSSPFAITFLRKEKPSQAMESSYLVSYPVSLFLQIVLVIILVHFAI